MPDLTTLRQDVLERIRVPEFATVAARAASIRRRRRAFAAGGAAAACLAVLGLAAVISTGDRQPPAPVAASPAVGPEWHGAGLTLLGLTDPAQDRPGSVVDVQFADAEHGFALTAECDQVCTLAVAATSDGGRTWVDWPLPAPNVKPSDLDDGRLFALGPEAVVLDVDRAWYGHSGRFTEAASGGPADTIPAGARLRVHGARDECEPAPLEAVATDGSRLRLTHQPGLSVCWAAAAAAPDGAWWVGGRVDGAPAVAVSRDNGRVWTVTSLGAADAGAWAQVSAVGTDIYAAVIAPRSGDTRAIGAVYRSRAGGAFTPYATRPGTVAGELVALPDGRLLAAGPGWFVGTTTLTPAGGSLPSVRRFAATPAGWVAYDLFGAGWVAWSPDGVVWRKLTVR